MDRNLIQTHSPQSVPVAGRVDLEAQEAREFGRVRVRVNLFQRTEQTLEVTLSLPLDPAYQAEARASDYFGLSNGGDVYFDIRYSVKMDFDAKRKQFDQEVKKIYGDKDNEILGKDQLEVVDERQLKKLLAPLATLGVNIFYDLFINPGNKLLRPDETHGEIVREAIPSVFSRPQIIQIRRDLPEGQKSALLFPWAFLYDDDSFDPSNRSTLRTASFWGFKHIIQEELECTATRRKLPAVPSILTAICSDADQTSWHKKPGHSLARHNGNITAATTVSELGKALANSTHDCFYFFGHASQPDPPEQTQSWLELRGQHLTVDALKRLYNAPRFSQNPVLAFLNGCRTAPLNVWNNESIVGFFCEHEHQRVCCVTTVASVPGSVAATFGNHFWKLFLHRKLPLGDAVLKTRRVMLRKWNNPLGLLYTVFGSVDTRLQR